MGHESGQIRHEDASPRHGRVWRRRESFSRPSTRSPTGLRKRAFSNSNPSPRRTYASRRRSTKPPCNRVRISEPLREPLLGNGWLALIVMRPAFHWVAWEAAAACGRAPASAAAHRRKHRRMRRGIQIQADSIADLLEQQRVVRQLNVAVRCGCGLNVCQMRLMAM
jgi:hypothetical protein